MAALTSYAARPMSTDDASTAEAGTCQVEAWHERAGTNRAAVLGAACGLLPGLELGFDSAWPTPHDVVQQQAGLAVKLVPAAWKLDTGVGELNLGLKLSGAWLKPASGSWQGSGLVALGLASLKPSDALTVHFNAGLARERTFGTNATVLNLALVWTPPWPVQLSLEAQGNTRRELFGGTVTTAAARWWLVKDVLGLDLTSSRERGAGGPTRYTVGVGWYGIGP